MTTVQMPSTNQPIDYDFINQLVNQVNSHDNFISQTSTNVTSSILGGDIVSSKLKFYAVQLSIPSDGKAVANTTVSVPTAGLTGFLNPPIIVATANSKDSASLAGCTVIVSNVTASNYNLSVRWLESKASGVDMFINVLAIGSIA